MFDQSFQVLSFSLKSSPSIPKTLFYCLRKGKIIAMDKGKNIQIELTKEELRRMIKWVTREIQEAKKEELIGDMVTTITKL